MPPSFVTSPSPLATAVVPTDVPPSIKFNSAVVAVTPSSMFNSVAVEVTPSSIFNSAAVEVIAVPARLSVPLISTAPFISTVVVAICTSVSATISS